MQRGGGEGESERDNIDHQSLISLAGFVTLPRLRFLPSLSSNTPWCLGYALLPFPKFPPFLRLNRCFPLELTLQKQTSLWAQQWMWFQSTPVMPAYNFHP